MLFIIILKFYLPVLEACPSLPVLCNSRSLRLYQGETYLHVASESTMMYCQAVRLSSFEDRTAHCDTYHTNHTMTEALRFLDLRVLDSPRADRGLPSDGSCSRNARRIASL